jgi:Rieske Fe-S protein
MLAAAGGACAAALAGCATYNANSGGLAGPPPTEAATGSAATGGAADVLISTAKVPVGGGTVVPASRVVVTQPTAGTFKAFTAVCTHRGCLVNAVANGTIDCPCHGSQFSATDGSVVHGPAISPLAPVAISVQGTSIVQAAGG